LKLKSKKDESQNCNQDQEKGKGRKDYSRMNLFFGRRLFSSRGVFPLSAMALGGFFWWRRSEMMKVCTSGFAERRRAILLAVEMHRE
jgi:hypothetical protein